MEPMERPDYGIDAPPVVRNLALGCAAGILLGIAARYLLTPVQPLIAAILASWGIFGGAFTWRPRG